jgi:hypothetical protein
LSGSQKEEGLSSFLASSASKTLRMATLQVPEGNQTWCSDASDNL